MELQDALKLWTRWKQTGQVCAHPHIEEETNLGQKTGDKVCTTCGEDFYKGKDADTKRQ